MKKINQAWTSVKSILSRKKYFLITISIAFIFFSLSILSKNFKLMLTLLTKTSPPEYFSLILGLYKEGITGGLLHATAILILISILLGVTISLIIFKIKSNGVVKGNISKSGTVGAVIGVAAPVCVPCGIGLLSVLGLGSVVAFLPFQGIELGILSIILLSYAIITLGSSIKECSSCQANLNNVNLSKKR
ncbi:hypothetical protein HOF78_01630 [Candidatus Woesearchaeota archaeon]|jgi:hypothetical protein|nr:hypothetical protein [Candidatus Woesearchaeota archaeon]MBT6044794.1 hypothetical protein [Candidatus Woesearchaeota archaeon]